MPGLSHRFGGDREHGQEPDPTPPRAGRHALESARSASPRLAPSPASLGPLGGVLADTTPAPPPAGTAPPPPPTTAGRAPPRHAGHATEFPSARDRSRSHARHAHPDRRQTLGQR